jgi:MinD-like ATPase involved in chromosome partitioning or flagellar assembly
VGKTFITALLGSLLAFLRRDRVVAVDANPDFGSLGRRLVPEHRMFIDELLAGPLRDGAPSVTSLDAQLGRGPNGLMVAPAPTDPTRAKRLDEDTYRSLFERLSTLAGTLVLDCGTGLDAPPARAALRCADQLVLVTDAQPDTASLVWEAARWLEHDTPPLVLLVNKVDRSSRLDVAALERTIPFARGLVEVPNDRAGADQLLASCFSWEQAPRGWREPLRELAALLLADWRGLGLAP